MDEHPYGQQQAYGHQNLDMPSGPSPNHPQRFGTPSDQLNIHAAVSFLSCSSRS